MQAVPLQPIPAQVLNISLGGQRCTLSIYQKSTGLYVDVVVDGLAKRSCVLARDRVRLIRQTYLGFVGDLAFVDTQGSQDPEYAGLGNRFLLVYLSPSEIV